MSTQEIKIKEADSKIESEISMIRSQIDAIYWELFKTLFRKLMHNSRTTMINDIIIIIAASLIQCGWSPCILVFKIYQVDFIKYYVLKQYNILNVSASNQQYGVHEQLDLFRILEWFCDKTRT